MSMEIKYKKLDGKGANYFLRGAKSIDAFIKIKDLNQFKVDIEKHDWINNFKCMVDTIVIGRNITEDMIAIMEQDPNILYLETSSPVFIESNVEKGPTKSNTTYSEEEKSIYGSVYVEVHSDYQFWTFLDAKGWRSNFENNYMGISAKNKAEFEGKNLTKEMIAILKEDPNVISIKTY